MVANWGFANSPAKQLSSEGRVVVLWGVVLAQKTPKMYFPIGWPKVLDPRIDNGEEQYRRILCNRDRILFAILSDSQITIWFSKVNNSVHFIVGTAKLLLNFLRRGALHFYWSSIFYRSTHLLSFCKYFVLLFYCLVFCRYELMPLFFTLKVYFYM